MHNKSSTILIAYATGSGCTETIARRIGEDLIAYGGRPKFVDVSQDKDGIDKNVIAVIFGSGVRVGRWHREGIDWLHNNKKKLQDIPFAVFSVGVLSVSNSESDRKQAYNDHLRQIQNIAPLAPVASAVFPGWKHEEHFSPIERIAFKMHPLDEGDYRDWDKVDAWVREIAPKLL